MTDTEKENSSVWKETGGILRVLDYEEAWKVWWKESSQKDKDSILNCEYFDQKIFKEITGLDVNKESELNLSGETVEVTIKGKKYKAVIT